MRPKMLRKIGQQPAVTYYKPQGIPLRELAEVTLAVEGLEALRLIDFEGMDQESAALQMGVSKATFCRVLAEARNIVATALTKGYALRIAGGNYVLDDSTAKIATCNCKAAK